MHDDPNNNDCEGNFNRLPNKPMILPNTPPPFLTRNGKDLVYNTYYNNIIDSFNIKARFVLSADFIRVQFSNLKTEMMQWKSHDIEVVPMDRLDKCTTNTLDTINKLS